VRYAAKVDANQGEIVKALRDIGCTVQSLAPVGGGVPDLLVGYHGVNYLLEVKDGSRPPSERGLTPHQEKFHASWRGQKTVVTSREEALAAVGVNVSWLPR